MNALSATCDIDLPAGKQFRISRLVSIALVAAPGPRPRRRYPATFTAGINDTAFTKGLELLSATWFLDLV